jgi:hypothetical protein
VVLLDVVDEASGVIGFRWGSEDDASYAFFQCGSERVDYGFVKVVQCFQVASSVVEEDGFFVFGYVAEDFPQDSAFLFQTNQHCNGITTFVLQRNSLQACILVL